MMRSLLADRFKLLVHFEKREHPVFDLLLARSDGRLSPAMELRDLRGWIDRDLRDVSRAQS
jgi:uncharacterized protein (TIGR03435 family)